MLDLSRDGAAVLGVTIPANLLAALDDLSDQALGRTAHDRRTGGIRDALRAVPGFRRICAEPAIADLAHAAIGPTAFVTRAILFDKNPDANWHVPWHQDTTIAVRERRDASGFGPWSVKAGTTHVQPPAGVLERMVTLRIGIDPCGDDNGPLLVIPGSHRHGILCDADIARWHNNHAPVACTTRAGGVVLMRPLCLHASAKAATPTRRRVLHLEYAADPLPDGLEWAVA